jgi:serine/threonine protein kinase
VGTPEFMAPELLTAGTHTTASDIYAFGLLLYEFCRCAQTMKRELGRFLMISAHLKVLRILTWISFSVGNGFKSRKDPYEGEDMSKVSLQIIAC